MKEWSGSKNLTRWNQRSKSGVVVCTLVQASFKLRPWQICHGCQLRVFSLEGGEEEVERGSFLQPFYPCQRGTSSPSLMFSLSPGDSLFLQFGARLICHEAGHCWHRQILTLTAPRIPQQHCIPLPKDKNQEFIEVQDWMEDVQRSPCHMFLYSLRAF